MLPPTTPSSWRRMPQRTKSFLALQAGRQAGTQGHGRGSRGRCLLEGQADRCPARAQLRLPPAATQAAKPSMHACHPPIHPSHPPERVCLEHNIQQQREVCYARRLPRRQLPAALRLVPGSTDAGGNLCCPPVVPLAGGAVLWRLQLVVLLPLLLLLAAATAKAGWRHFSLLSLLLRRRSLLLRVAALVARGRPRLPQIRHAPILRQRPAPCRVWRGAVAALRPAAGAAGALLLQVRAALHLAYCGADLTKIEQAQHPDHNLLSGVPAVSSGGSIADMPGISDGGREKLGRPPITTTQHPVLPLPLAPLLRLPCLSTA